MNRLPLLLALLSLAGSSNRSMATAAAPGSSASPAAIVASLSGSVTVQQDGRARRALALFDRLPVGATVQTSSDGSVRLVFRGGERVQLGAGSRGRLEAAGVARLDGVVTRLASVSPVPLVAPVRAAGTTITAVRIRAADIRVVSPAYSMTTRPEHTVLRFSPVAAASGYDIEVESSDATVVYRTRSEVSEVPVPAGVLQAGRDYRWLVRTHGAAGFVLTGEGRFFTLAREDDLARARLQASLASEAGAAALLAEVDWTLGLWHEALAGFRQADQGDAVITGRIAEIERRLAGPVPGGH